MWTFKGSTSKVEGDKSTSVALDHARHANEEKHLAQTEKLVQKLVVIQAVV
jgi:hypothetical protein